MAEVPAVKILRCAGCGRTFNDEEDVCPLPHVIGAADVGYLCPRCHVTVLGSEPQHEYRQDDLLP
jgi:DNA-directed RNA polymerase subunit RPC12/RpoP